MNRTFLLVSCLLFVTALSLVVYKYNHRGKEVASGLVVMNVLDTDLYQDCHIPGSINVTLDTLSPEWCKGAIASDAEIVVYCSNYYCSTSGYVAKKLKEYGYSRVYVYEGGIAEWYQKGYPVVGSCKQTYLSSKVDKPLHDNQGDIDTIALQELANKMKITQNTTAA